MKIFFTIILFTSLLISFDTQELKVGVYDNPPKIYMDTDSKPRGFFIDILNEIAKQENWHLEYVHCRWGECLDMLEKGELDIMPDVAYSKERQKHLLFNQEVALSSWSVVYVNKKSDISSILDLDERKVAILGNSIQHEQIKDTFKLYDIHPSLVLTADYNDSLKLLKNKKVDAAIVNKHFGDLNKDKFRVKKTSILINPAIIKFAFTNMDKNLPVAKKIDMHLKEFKSNKDSVYYASTKKYLTAKEHFKIPKWLKITILIILGVIVFLIFTVMFFRHLLKLKTKEILNKSIQFQELQKEKLEDYKKILYALISMIEQRDSYTAGHSQRVAKYSKLIAKEMGCSTQDQELIFKAATLHDIGKIATPDAILLKPERLSSLEYELIKEHVNIGVNILKDIPMFKDISNIIKYHHEKYDGSGYPNGILKDDIPLLSRVMMVADAFDAMTTNRIYKHKKSQTEAFEELRSLSGIHYHPEVVDAALKALKNVEIQDFNQNPITAVEEQRFVYFYKDFVTDLYNAKYLEATFMNDEKEQRYKEALIVSLHKFDIYNKKHGWEEGNAMLKEFASFLQELFKDSLIFRIRANDFIILPKKPYQETAIKRSIEDFMQSSEIEFDLNVYDLKKNKIYSYDDIKRFL